MSIFFINLYKKKFSKIQDLTQSHLKSTLKKPFLYVHYSNRIMNVFSKVLPISRVVANG